MMRKQLMANEPGKQNQSARTNSARATTHSKTTRSKWQAAWRFWPLVLA